MSGDTQVLMGYGRVKRLAAVRVGDLVYGTELRDGIRHFVRTEVTAHWQTVQPAFRIDLEDGTELVASGDHRVLTASGWRCASGKSPDGEPWPRLEADDWVIGPGRGLGRAATLAGTAMPDDARARVVSVEPLGVDMAMYDVTTGSGDFIANGVVSHNCFARGSHIVARARHRARLRLRDRREGQRCRGAGSRTCPPELEPRTRRTRDEYRSLPARRGALSADAGDHRGVGVVENAVLRAHQRNFAAAGPFPSGEGCDRGPGSARGVDRDHRRSTAQAVGAGHCRHPDPDWVWCKRFGKPDSTAE